MKESCKQNSPSKASLRGELQEAQRHIRRLEERLQKLDMQQAGPSHAHHAAHHSHRHSSRGSSDAFGREEGRRRREPNHSFHGYDPRGRDHRDNGYYREAKARLPLVKLPSFNGDSDPNIYLDWEAKCEQIFDLHGVQDEHKYKLATLEFCDYAMQWWHGLVKDIMFHKGPPVGSWNSLRFQMRARFVPPHFRKDLMLKLQRFHQGALSVDDYFKQLDTLLIRVNMDESDEAKIASSSKVMNIDPILK